MPLELSSILPVLLAWKCFKLRLLLDHQGKGEGGLSHLKSINELLTLKPNNDVKLTLSLFMSCHVLSAESSRYFSICSFNNAFQPSRSCESQRPPCLQECSETKAFIESFSAASFFTWPSRKLLFSGQCKLTIIQFQQRIVKYSFYFMLVSSFGTVFNEFW